MKKLIILISLIAVVGAGLYVVQVNRPAEEAIVEVPAQPVLVDGQEVERVTSVTDYRELPASEASLTPMVNGLDAPWAFAWLPNGELLVTERFGTLRLVRDGQLVSEPITGVPDVFASGQGGLLDVAVHPDFASNRYIYLSYAHGTEEGNRLRVARAELEGMSLQNLTVIFETAQTKYGGQHFGSRFAWLPDQTLLFSVGDGGNPPTEYNGELIREQAQNLTAHLGKIIRINDDGSVPEDNPFVGRPDVLHEIYSYGHRNIQGIAFDSVHNRLFASEHGSKGGDELNAPVPGGNFGWPEATYSTEYAPPGARISSDQSVSGMIDPLIAWTPTIAPSAVVHYTGDQYGDAVNDSLFVAAMLLRDSDSILSYVGNPPGAILRVVTDENGNATNQQRIMVGDVRVRSIAQGPDGYLHVLTDQTGRINGPGSQGGTLWRVDAL